MSSEPITIHAHHHDPAAVLPFGVHGWAVAGILVCILGSLWWAWVQRAEACADCGGGPAFCRCAGERAGGHDRD